MCFSTAFSENLTGTDNTLKHNEIALRHSIGSTLCLLKNIGADKPMNYGQLNYGYRLTPKDNLLVEAITSNYYEPLRSNGNSDIAYPGKVFSAGLGLGYQRFLCKHAFTSVVATPYLQRFYDANDTRIQDGFLLYIHGTVGYRFQFFRQRWFLEPMVGVAYWPVNTNLPASFAAVESGQLDYKLEPKIKFGYRF
jgi:hypothetical protein